MVVVEVRQGTLGVDGRGWGPDEEDEDDEDDEEDEEDDEEEAEGGAGEAEGMRSGRRGRRQATNIKSNNPHLAGGEKKTQSRPAPQGLELLDLSQNCPTGQLPQDQVAHAKPNVPKLRHFGAQVAASYAEVGPKWAPVRPNLRPRTAK